MDIFLKGNGHWCADCGGTGKARSLFFVPGNPMIAHDRIPVAGLCPSCKGEGRRKGHGPNRPAPPSSRHALHVAALMAAARQEHERALLDYPAHVREPNFESRVQASNEIQAWQKVR